MSECLWGFSISDRDCNACLSVKYMVSQFLPLCVPPDASEANFIIHASVAAAITTKELEKLLPRLFEPCLFSVASNSDNF